MRWVPGLNCGKYQPRTQSFPGVQIQDGCHIAIRLVFEHRAKTTDPGDEVPATL